MSAVILEADKVGIQAILDNYISSVIHADIEAYALNIVHDPDMVNFGTDASERFVGWTALRNAIVAQNAALSETEIHQHDVTINLSADGRFAWATSLWDFKAVLDGQALEAPIRCTWILEKQEDGWKIIHFHKSIGATG